MSLIWLDKCRGDCEWHVWLWPEIAWGPCVLTDRQQVAHARRPDISAADSLKKPSGTSWHWFLLSAAILGLHTSLWPPRPKEPTKFTKNLHLEPGAQSDPHKPAEPQHINGWGTHLFLQECLMGRSPGSRNASPYPHRCLRRSQTRRCRRAPCCPSTRGQAGNTAQEGPHTPPHLYTRGRPASSLETPPIGWGEGHAGGHDGTWQPLMKDPVCQLIRSDQWSDRSVSDQWSINQVKTNRVVNICRATTSEVAPVTHPLKAPPPHQTGCYSTVPPQA